MGRSQEVIHIIEEHRNEFVAKRNEVTFVNNAISFNCNSVWYMFEIYESIIWITPGIDKLDKSCAFLRPICKEKVRIIIVIGEETNTIHLAFSEVVECIVQASSMKQAVEIAIRFAEVEDTILLSPLYPSDYKTMGRQFKNAVHDLSY